MTTKNMDVIELNGNLYDALTGAYIGKDGARTATGASGRSGVTQTGPRHADLQTHAAKPASPAAAHRSTRVEPKHIPAHKPQRAQTLMRHAVKRPQPATAVPAAPAVKAKAVPAITSVKPAVAIHTPKAATISPDPQRSQRAQTTAKSHMISRFRHIDVKPVSTPAATPVATSLSHSVTKSVPTHLPKQASKQASIPVTVPTRQTYHIKPPAKPDVFSAQPLRQNLATTAKPLQPQSSRQPAGRSLDFISSTAKPTQAAQVTPVAAKAPAAAHPHHQPQPQLQTMEMPQPRPMRRQPVQHYSRPHPAAVQQSAARSASRSAPADHDDQGDADIFEHALAMARSHEQKPVKQSLLSSAKQRKRARRIISLAASAAVFMLLCGFIAYQNKAAIQLEMASAKAGFAASAPLYKPEGYAMSRISYEPGTVETSYSNGNDDKDFAIVQKKSNWDSQTLLENFVAPKSGDYQGYQSGGRTVYVYGEHNATWVNGGTWYQLDAAGTGMNDEQLVKVAASM